MNRATKILRNLAAAAAEQARLYRSLATAIEKDAEERVRVHRAIADLGMEQHRAIADLSVTQEHLAGVVQLVRLVTKDWKCRNCGCTDEQPCAIDEARGACSWVEKDLCTACAEEVPA